VGSADFYVELAAAGSDSGVVPTGVKTPASCAFGTLTQGIAAAAGYATDHPDASVSVWAVSSTSGAVQHYRNETFPLVLPSQVTLKTTATTPDPARDIIHYNSAANGALAMYGNAGFEGMTIVSDLPISGIGNGIDIRCGADAGFAPAQLSYVSVVVADGGSNFSNGVAMQGLCSAWMTNVTVRNAVVGITFYGGTDAGLSINGGTFDSNGIGIEQQGGTFSLLGGVISNSQTYGFEAFSGGSPVNVTLNTVSVHDNASAGFETMSGAPLPVNVALYNNTFYNNGLSVSIGAGTVVATNDTIAYGDAGLSAFYGISLGGQSAPVHANLSSVQVTGFAALNNAGIDVESPAVVEIGGSSLSGGYTGLLVNGGTVDAGQLQAMNNSWAGIWVGGGTLSCFGCVLNANTNPTPDGAGLYVTGGSATIWGQSALNNNDYGVWVDTGGVANLLGPPPGSGGLQMQASSNNTAGVYAYGDATSFSAVNALFAGNGQVTNTHDNVEIDLYALGSFNGCTFQGPTARGRAQLNAVGTWASLPGYGLSVTNCIFNGGDVAMNLGDPSGVNPMTAQVMATDVSGARGPGIIYNGTTGSSLYFSQNWVTGNDSAWDGGLYPSGGMLIGGAAPTAGSVFSFQGNKFYGNGGTAQVDVFNGTGWTLNGPPACGNYNEFYCYGPGQVGVAAEGSASANVDQNAWMHAKLDAGIDYRSSTNGITFTAPPCAPPSPIAGCGPSIP
jgi:hypothetical protein